MRHDGCGRHWRPRQLSTATPKALRFQRDIAETKIRARSGKNEAAMSVVSLSSDFEAARAALLDQREKSCFLVLQLDKTVGEEVQVVSSGIFGGHLSLSDADFSFVLYKLAKNKRPFLLYYRGPNVPPHLLSATLTKLVHIVKLLEPFEQSLAELTNPEASEEEILALVQK